MNDGMRRTLGFARRVFRRKGALLSVVFLATVTFVAVFARWIVPYDPIGQDLIAALEPPSTRHWFGADELGRDIMSRVIYGARTSLLTAAGAAWLASRKGTSEDSAVGVMLSVMFAGGIALMQQANSWRDFAGLLFGSVVSVGREDLLVIGVTATLVLFGLRALHKELELASFDEEYASLLGARPALMRVVLLVLVALGSVACVRLVGALLTTALFVIPAATGVLLGRTLPQVMAWGTGCALLGGVSGLYLSYYATAVPSGAGIVLCCALPYLVARIFAPRR